jgi:hypothetical protein
MPDDKLDPNEQESKRADVKKSCYQRNRRIKAIEKLQFSHMIFEIQVPLTHFVLEKELLAVQQRDFTMNNDQKTSIGVTLVNFSDLWKRILPYLSKHK